MAIVYTLQCVSGLAKCYSNVSNPVAFDDDVVGPNWGPGSFGLAQVSQYYNRLYYIHLPALRPIHTHSNAYLGLQQCYSNVSYPVAPTDDVQGSNLGLGSFGIAQILQYNNRLYYNHLAILWPLYTHSNVYLGLQSVIPMCQTLWLLMMT